MATDKQLFAPVPLRAMALDLSGLDLRVLICICAHDRLSLVTGKGQGCRASNERMRQMIGCSYAALCKTLSKLVSLELLHREPLGRHTVYRVVYTGTDMLLFGNVSRLPIGSLTASDDRSTCCQEEPNGGAKPPETAPQYIPLNGRNRFCETGEYNSSEEARFSAGRIDGINLGLTAGGKDTRQKAGQSTAARAKSIGEKLAILERRLNAGEEVDHLAEYRWLGDEEFMGERRIFSSGHCGLLNCSWMGCRPPCSTFGALKMGSPRES